METRKLLCWVILLVVLFSAPYASAQVVYGQKASGSVQFLYNSWSTEILGEKTTLSQYVMPFTGFVPVRENFDVTLFVASSGNSVEIPIGGEYDLAGMSDIRIQGRHSFADDRLLLAVGFNLPSGKQELDSVGESFVLQELAQNYYELPMRRMGEGFGFNVLLGGATMAGENLKLGGGISYQFVGKYKPYVGYGDYNPGDAISFTTRGELEQGPWTWTLDLLYAIQTTDKLDGVETFRQAPQFDARLLANHQGDGLGYGGMLRYVARGENDVYDLSGEKLSSLKLFGSEFALAGHLSWLMAEQWHVVPSLEVRFIGSNDVYVDKSTVWGFGTNVGRDLGKHIAIEGGLKFYTGSATVLVSEAPETTVSYDADISGYQITLGLNAAL